MVDELMSGVIRWFGIASHEIDLTDLDRAAALELRTIARALDRLLA